MEKPAVRADTPTVRDSGQNPSTTKTTMASENAAQLTRQKELAKARKSWLDLNSHRSSCMKGLITYLDSIDAMSPDDAPLRATSLLEVARKLCGADKFTDAMVIATYNVITQLAQLDAPLDLEDIDNRYALATLVFIAIDQTPRGANSLIADNDSVFRLLTGNIIAASRTSRTDRESLYMELFDTNWVTLYYGNLQDKNDIHHFLWRTRPTFALAPAMHTVPTPVAGNLPDLA